MAANISWHNESTFPPTQNIGGHKENITTLAGGPQAERRHAPGEAWGVGRTLPLHTNTAGVPLLALASIAHSWSSCSSVRSEAKSDMEHGACQ